MVARLICLRLFWHFIRLAASRTFWTAGKRRPIRMAMMAMTTSNSISVKPRQRRSIRANGMTTPSGEVRRGSGNDVDVGQFRAKGHETIIEFRVSPRGWWVK
jgi:hypothetical protein